MAGGAMASIAATPGNKDRQSLFPGVAAMLAIALCPYETWLAHVTRNANSSRIPYNKPTLEILAVVSIGAGAGGGGEGRGGIAVAALNAVVGGEVAGPDAA